jgi:hypothetical protein
MFSGQETLTSAAFDRLDGYRLMAARRGLVSQDGKWSTPVAIAKVCQRSEHSNSIFVDAAPSLLRATFLWDLIRDEPIGPTSHWLIQGFASPSVPSLCAHISPSCPVGLMNVSTGLSGSTQKVLAGNSMHVAAIGTWTLFVLTSIDAGGLARSRLHTGAVGTTTA